MSKATKAIGGAVGLLAFVVGVGWLGLQVNPAPFPPHPESTREPGTAELPSDLPGPVYRHFQAVLGEGVPRIGTAVVWGRGEFNLMGLWFPMRFKSYHEAGRSFRSGIESVW